MCLKCVVKSLCLDCLTQWIFCSVHKNLGEFWCEVTWCKTPTENVCLLGQKTPAGYFPLESWLFNDAGPRSDRHVDDSPFRPSSLTCWLCVAPWFAQLTWCVRQMVTKWFQTVFSLIPMGGKWSTLTNIFPMGWNRLGGWSKYYCIDEHFSITVANNHLPRQGLGFCKVYLKVIRIPYETCNSIVGRCCLEGATPKV